MAKWLAGTLEPVLKLYSKHCIYDKLIQNASINLNNSFRRREDNLLHVAKRPRL